MLLRTCFPLPKKSHPNSSNCTHSICVVFIHQLSLNKALKIKKEPHIYFLNVQIDKYICSNKMDFEKFKNFRFSKHSFIIGS